MEPPSPWHRPTPSVTQIVWPFGWVCHAVRASGVKWTLDAATREPSEGAAIASMNTEPVNHSLGPGLVSRLFLVICIDLSLVVSVIVSSLGVAEGAGIGDGHSHGPA